MGKVFGRLTVKRKSETQKKGRVSWYCLCECGKYCDVSSKELLGGGTNSCGCLRTENSRMQASQLAINVKKKSNDELDEMKTRMVKNRVERHYVDGVDTTALTMKKRVDNKSGVKGVHFDKSRNKWKVDIGLGGKAKYIGRFDTLEEAKEARGIAESIYHEPILNKAKDVEG